MDCIDFGLKTFNYHHEIDQLYVVVANKLLDLSGVFLNIRKHSFSVIFRNVFGVISEGRIMGNDIFGFVSSPTSPESYHLDLFLYLLELLTTLALF